VRAMPSRFESCVTLSRIGVLALALTVGSRSATLACGYHDDVSLARGFLNWIYPDALHVLGAITGATVEGRLPAPKAAAPAREVFGTGYRETIRSQERLAAAFRSASANQRSRFAVSIVLVEPMLWTRFNADEGGELNAQMHVSGPERGDLIAVSGEMVVAALADSRLTIGEAQRAGLIRLYGSDEQIAWFLVTFRDVGRNGFTSPAEDQTHPIDSAAAQRQAP
jgi:hypothetical protein